MAELPSVFNAKDNEKMQGFEPVPPGWYPAEVVKSEMRNTKDKTGKYLNLQHKITDGDYKGRIIFTMLNLVNKSQQAVDIAQRELASLCEACEIDEIEDSVELHDIEHWVKAKIVPASGNFPAKNAITAYSKDMPEEASE